MPTTYYKVHGGRLSFAEYWRMSPNPLVFVIAAGAKLFGGLPMNFSIPRVDQLHLVEKEELPKLARRELADPVKSLERAGMTIQFYHELPVLEKERIGCAAVLLDGDGYTFATVNFVKDANQQKVGVNCVSRFTDGDFGVTSDQKKELKPDPRHHVDRLVGADPEDLYERHLNNLENWRDDGLQAQRLNRDSTIAAVLAGEQGLVDFHAKRKVFVPMTKAEIRRIRIEQADPDE